ncbi:MAG: peptidylprolyl isomerase [Oscillospiraceae bacterium]|nr:peptidylprolyl isomerase [Oscillospiraceae bacterium]
MKKFIIGIVAVLLVFGIFMVWSQNNGKTPAVPAPAAATEAAAETPAPEVHGLDYEAIRALYPEDYTAITLEDEKIDWGFYADFLRATGLQYEEYFAQMAAYYGVAAEWTGSIGDGSGMTYAEGMRQETNDTLASFMAIRAFAKEKNVELDEETLEKLTPEHMAADYCGEGATVEDLAAELESGSHLTVDGLRYYSESVALYSALFQELYGAEGEKLTDEEVIAALEEEGYLSAGHILFMTIDPSTGKELEESVITEKLKQADAVVEELRAIKDPDEMLERFAELKEQYCEDTGKQTYPDGYTFTTGTMVKEFEETVKALGEYEISDPVKTSYGYHVIVRLPLRSDSTLMNGQSSPVAARQSVAQNGITKALDTWFEAHPATYAEGVEELDLTKFVK